jgi:acyl-CoA thioesterase-2
VQSILMPNVPAPDSLEASSWTETFDRVVVPAQAVQGPSRDGAGRMVVWMKVNQEVGNPANAATQLLHRSWLAFLSDDIPTEAVMQAHPEAAAVMGEEDRFFGASLDHTIWFHRPLRADRWHLYDFSCQHFVGGRGLAHGHIFSADGTHVATVTQEVLLRDRAAKP